MRIVSCTRAEAWWQIGELAEGWDHLGHQAHMWEAIWALGKVADGRTEVTVGHTVYRIQEAQAS